MSPKFGISEGFLYLKIESFWRFRILDSLVFLKFRTLESTEGVIFLVWYFLKFSVLESWVFLKVLYSLKFGVFLKIL